MVFTIGCRTHSMTTLNWMADLLCPCHHSVNEPLTHMYTGKNCKTKYVLKRLKGSITVQCTEVWFQCYVSSSTQWGAECCRLLSHNLVLVQFHFSFPERVHPIINFFVATFFLKCLEDTISLFVGSLIPLFLDFWWRLSWVSKTRVGSVHKFNLVVSLAVPSNFHYLVNIRPAKSSLKWSGCFFSQNSVFRYFGFFWNTINIAT